MTTVSDKVMCSTSLEVTGEKDDPLSELGVCNQDTLYNLNINVFANPLESINEDIDYLESDFNFFNDIGEGEALETEDNNVTSTEETTNPNIIEASTSKEVAPTPPVLVDHMHTMFYVEKKIVCQICGKSFSDAKFMRHKSVHEVKVRECSICSKKLSGRTNMAIHLRTHTQPRPHKCETCGKMFARKYSLKVHIRFVHQKEFNCSRCGERFEKRNLLSRHNSTVHKA